MQIAPSPSPSAGQPYKQAKSDLQQAAKAFEAIFLRQMISTMRSANLGDGLTDNGATEQFRDMADARTADNMAATGRFGIAELLMKQLGTTLPTADPSAPATGNPA